MPQLQLTSIGKLFRGSPAIQALRDVDLTISQGDFVAIEGPSGGGKSTMLNVIGLLDKPSSGSYAVGAVDVASATPRVLAKVRSDQFAFIFQSFHLLNRRPVVESVEMGLIYRGVPRQERRVRALRALEAVELRQYAYQQANKLSGGQQQRVAIARALATGAPVLVADEPTGNLDGATSDLIVKFLCRLNAAGTTIVLVTHSPSVAAAASRRLQIEGGSLVEDPDSSRSKAVSSPGGGPPRPPGRASKLKPDDLLLDALASVRSRVGRSLGLVAAVALGVALAVSTLGIAASATAQVSDTFDAHANRDVTLSWDTGALEGESAQAIRSIVPRLRTLSATEFASGISNFGAHTLQADASRPGLHVTAYASTSELAAASRSTIRWAGGHRHALARGEILLGSNLARQAGIGPLDSTPIVSLDSRDVAVVGLVTSSPRVPDFVGSVIAPDADRELLGTDSQDEILILTAPGGAQQIARQAPLVVQPYEPKQITIDRPEDPSTVRAQVEADLQSTLLALTAVALLASVAGLANAMILSVMERKQEFGLRRAVGARPVHLLGLVLSESAVVGALGGLVGLVLGLGGILTVTVLRHWSPVFDLRLAPMAILGGILVGALGGAFASVRASRIQPNEALRQ